MGRQDDRRGARPGPGREVPKNPYADAGRSGGRVPGQDAFKDLPKRKPPSHLPGYQPPPEATPPPPPRKSRPEAEAERKAPPKKRRRPRKAEVNPAKRRRRRRITAAVLILLCIAAGVTVTLTVLFKIEKYQIQGDIPYSREEVLRSFGHEVGENMFGFSAATAESRIELQLPYIEEVTIRRRLPGTILLRVTAATEAYCVPWQGGYAVLSAQLKMLRSAEEPPEGLPILYGLTDVRLEEGRPLAADASAGLPLTRPEDFAPSSSSEAASLPDSDAAEAGEAGEVDEAEAGETDAGAAEETGAANADAGEETGGESESEPASSKAESAEGSVPQEAGEAASGAQEAESNAGAADAAEASGADGGASAAGSGADASGSASDAGVDQVTLLRQVLAALEEAELTDITWVDVGDALALRFCWEGRITVKLGTRGSLPEKMRFAAVLFADTEQITPGDRGTLDVSFYPDSTDRVWLVPEG